MNGRLDKLAATIALLAVTAISASTPFPALAGGLLDPSLGVRGTLLSRPGFGDSRAHGIVQQPDGKLVVLAQSYRSPSTCFTLIRHLVERGAVDWAFGTGGMTTSCFGGTADATPRSLALQADGKIVAAGTVYDGAAASLLVARYLTNGQLDAAFGDAGTVRTGTLGAFAEWPSVAIEPASGNVVVSGASIEGDFVLVRYTPGGAVDPTFGNDGIVRTDLGGLDIPRAATLQPDGRIVVAGYSYVDGVGTPFAVVRYMPDGTLDTSFAGDGSLVTTGIVEGVPATVLVQPDGAIVVGGGEGAVTLLRCDANGTLDPTFGTGGVVSVGLRGDAWPDAARAIVRQPDGKILVAGASYDGRYDDVAVARFTATGQLDPSFGSSGQVFVRVGPTSERAEAMVLQADGRLVVAGAGSTGTQFSATSLLRFVGIECGDHEVDAGEICDDGNVDDGDGCDSNCTPTACGNFVVTAGEQCDDGNGRDGDGCQSDCTIAGLGVGACSAEDCGNGIVNVSCEQCDDGDRDPLDGCDAQCLDETGFEQELAPGETATTDADADGATLRDPVEVGVTAAQAGFYTAYLTSTNGAATGFSIFGRQIDLTGPSASQEAPLLVRFRLEGSLVEPGLEQALAVLRNGLAVPACQVDDGRAIPNPCISSRTRLPDDDVQLTVLTSDFSEWSYGLLDRDGDDRPDDADACSVVDPGQRLRGATIDVGGLSRGAGGNTLKVAGAFTLPAAAALAPDQRGAHVRIADAARPLMDVSVPPASAGSCSSRDGWKANRARTSFTYRNASGFLDPACQISSQGLSRIVVKDRRTTRHADVQIQAQGKRGTYSTTIPVVRLEAQIALAALGVRGSASVEAILGNCTEAIWGPGSLGDATSPTCTVRGRTDAPSALSCRAG